MPAHEGEIDPLERPLPNELLQAGMRLGRPRHHHQPGRVAVEPVHDPRPVVVAPRNLAGQRVHESPRRVSGPRMHDEACRLVDHQKVLVLPDDRRLGRRRFDRSGRLGRELDLLPAFETKALRPRNAVHQRAELDCALGRGARAEVRREETVETLPRRIGGNRELHRAATSSVRRGGCGLRSVTTSAPSRITTPNTMNESARLNAGQ